MYKNFKPLGLIIICLGLLVGSFIPSFSQAYVRENSFLNASGSTRIAEIKKFQARNNLVVDGQLNTRTKEALYNPNYMPYDKVENPPSQGYWIVINKTKRILTVYKADQVDVKFPVTLGSRATPTPSAKSRITNMAVNPAWGGMGGRYTPRAANDPLNPLGERWIGLHIPNKSGYGIHGTIKPHEIGMSVSNGCIRMFNYDIENFVYPKMKSGAPVWIGTDQELNSWGVYQYLDLVDKNPPKETIEDKTDQKPVEEPDKVKEENAEDKTDQKPVEKTDKTKKANEKNLEDKDKVKVEEKKVVISPPVKLDPPKISIDGQIIPTDTDPLIENGRTLVPIRVISEHLGYQVNWNADNKTVEVLDKTFPEDGDYILEDVLILEIDSKIARRLEPDYYETLDFDTRKSREFISTIEDEAQEITIDVEAKLSNDRTMVPIRFIAEEFGLDVNWDNKTRTVLISKD